MAATPGYCSDCGTHGGLHRKGCPRLSLPPDGTPAMNAGDVEERTPMTELELETIKRQNRIDDESTRRASLGYAAQLCGGNKSIAEMIRDAKMIYEWEINGTVPTREGNVEQLRTVN